MRDSRQQWKVGLCWLIDIWRFAKIFQWAVGMQKVSYFSSTSLAKIPVRLNVGIMLFMASFTSYMLRVNFSIIIIAMSKLTSPARNATEQLMAARSEDNEPFDDSFHWSKKDQGLLLSAYFYGYIFPNLLGGFLSERFGGRIVIFLTMILSAIVTGISPLAANDNFLFMFTARLVLGILGVTTQFLADYQIIF